MERWQNDKEKEVWRENVIYAVKYGLEHSNVSIAGKFFFNIHQYTEKLQKLNETIQENDEKIQVLLFEIEQQNRNESNRIYAKQTKRI